MISIEGLILLIGAIGGFVSLVFSNLRQSRCTDIQCACIKCKRDVMTKSMMQIETKTGDEKNATGNAI